jgi:polyvinyl alcohol dehydrogenase (cytochrome)
MIQRTLAAAAALALSLGTLSLGACAPRPDPADPAVLAERIQADAEHPGRQVYQEWCAACHDNGQDTRATGLDGLRQLNRAHVNYTLTYGYMKREAQNVPKEDLAQLIDWLPQNEEAGDAWVDEARCPIKRRRVRLDASQTRAAVTFGLGPRNERRISAGDSGLATADMKDLELAWVVAFPNAPTMRSQPVLVGDTLFLAATDAGRLYALDADTGCVKWMYVSDMTLRSSLSFAEATARSPAAIVMGDAAGRVHAVAAETGRRLWVTDVSLNDLNRITGAPVVNGDRVYAPLSAIEVNYTQYDDYECCKGQGAIVALDLATGAKVWTGRTMEEAKPTVVSRTGTQQWGPSGAIIWSTPAIDEARGVLYAGTGENTSWPATDTSDAIIAYDLATGERRWSFQATAADIWNYACGRNSANCDWPGVYHSPDFDFGGSAMIVKRKDGRDLVVAGQKSGVVWAIDPDNKGALVWSNRVGRGAANGGIHWGVATDGERVFAPLNDPTEPPGHPAWGPGLHALDLETGDILWTYKPTAADCGEAVPAGVTTRPAPGLEKLAIAAPTPVMPREQWYAWTRPGPDLAIATGNTAPAVATNVSAPRPAAPQPQATPPSAPAPGATPAAAPASAPAAAPRIRARCRFGMSPAPLVVDGAVVTGNLTGMLRIFDGATGEVLFEYQTNRDYPDTVNGLPGDGGALDSHPYIAGRGTLYVQSGYARFGQNPGNVLLAFRPRREQGRAFEEPLGNN